MGKVQEVEVGLEKEIKEVQMMEEKLLVEKVLEKVQEVEVDLEKEVRVAQMEEDKVEKEGKVQQVEKVRNGFIIIHFWELLVNTK